MDRLNAHASQVGVGGEFAAFRGSSACVRAIRACSTSILRAGVPPGHHVYCLRFAHGGVAASNVVHVALAAAFS